MLEKFEADPETKYVVLVGEIGGDEEEKAARYVAEHMSKPVFSYIAGFSAPPGKTMGHAGAIISGSSGTAAAKKDALEAVGIKVGTTPTEVAELVVAAARELGHDLRTRATRTPPLPRGRVSLRHVWWQPPKRSAHASGEKVELRRAFAAPVLPTFGRLPAAGRGGVVERTGLEPRRRDSLRRASKLG